MWKAFHDILLDGTSLLQISSYLLIRVGRKKIKQQSEIKQQRNQESEIEIQMK